MYEKIGRGSRENLYIYLVEIQVPVFYGHVQGQICQARVVSDRSGRIGMALVGEPDLLVLDEPINGLDPEGIAEVRETLLRLNKEKGLTIIISSHILEELSKIATNYAIIDKGQLVKELSREELEATCREHIEIKMDHPDLALPVLDALGFKDYRVADENTIHIFERLNESGKITMELSRKNIYIHSISVTNESIEDYFLRLTGGVDHA